MRTETCLRLFGCLETGSHSPPPQLNLQTGSLWSQPAQGNVIKPNYSSFYSYKHWHWNSWNDPDEMEWPHKLTICWSRRYERKVPELTRHSVPPVLARFEGGSPVEGPSSVFSMYPREMRTWKDKIMIKTVISPQELWRRFVTVNMVNMALIDAHTCYLKYAVKVFSINGELVVRCCLQACKTRFEHLFTRCATLG